ncbi:hypothetical protein JCM10207_004473 [Rhodosporidiobolus poonsookiae]
MTTAPLSNGTAPSPPSPVSLPDQLDLGNDSFNSLDDINKTYDLVEQTFLSGVTRDLKWRKEQLLQLGLMLEENESAFVTALESDLCKPKSETLFGEVHYVKAEINDALANLDKWAAPTRVSTAWMWKAAKPTVRREPKGVVLIIGTWNYPISLTLTPLIGAIAGGNTAIIKPAEQSPAFSLLLHSLLPRYLSPSAFRLILGAVPQTTHLLTLRFDHIFYTGSGRVGKIVAKAAAEHLTPVTLELGGKSPAVVLEDADVEVAARRIAWSKWVNSGQICIAADYILTVPSLEAPLISALRRALSSFRQPDASAGLYPPTALVSLAAYDRLGALLDKTEGEVVIGGGRKVEKGEDGREWGRMEVTVVKGVKGDDALMSEELFGPILPVVTLPSDEAIADFIAGRGAYRDPRMRGGVRETPLAIYAFTGSKKRAEYLFSHTRSGTFLHGDCVVQFIIPGLPFGGAGAAGYGNYHGKASFDAFTHERPSAHVPTWMEALMAKRYPPYSDAKLAQLLLFTGAVVRRPRKYGFGVWIKLVALVGAVWAVAVKSKRA